MMAIAPDRVTRFRSANRILDVELGIYLGERLTLELHFASSASLGIARVGTVRPQI